MYKKIYKLISNEQGVTLIEILIAIFILGVVGVGFASSMGTGLMADKVADERTIAESLARTQLESIKRAPYNGTSPYGYAKITGIPAGYDINIAVNLINPNIAGNSATDLGIQKIRVTVFRGSNQILQLETYKK